MSEAGPIDRPSSAARSRVQRVGLVAGVAFPAALLLLPTFPTFVAHAAGALQLPGEHADVVELARGMQATLAILSIMVVWWVTEAAPIPVTALLPGLLLPLLHVRGRANGAPFDFGAQASFASYASPVIYLFLAGFLLAGAMRKTGLDRRITLGVLSWRPMMRGPGTILLVVMGITGMLSMWISNTAATAMMLPIAAAILGQLGERPGASRLGAAMMLGIAWSASLGGIGTLIGTPPNGIVVGILRRQGIAQFSFVDWMKIGLPIACGGVVAAWALLMAMHRPRLHDTSAGRRAIGEARRALGAWRVEEAATLVAFGLVATLWVTQPFWSALLPARMFERLEWFDVDVIGLAGALLLFVVPVSLRDWRTVLEWRDAQYVDWGTLLLFGGGIALSEAMFKTGLTEWMAAGFVSWIGRPGPIVSLALVAFAMSLLTEVTSNTAVTSMLTPVLIGVAPQLGLDPVLLTMTGAVAASLAFMLPVATPPNALVYAAGYFRIAEMARRGFFMDLVGTGLVVSGMWFSGAWMGWSRAG